MSDQKNTILAIVLSVLVFIAWQYFFGLPQQEKQKQLVQQQQQTQQTQAPPAPAETRPQAPGQVPGTAQTTGVSREEALARSPAFRSTPVGSWTAARSA
jgi:YidC/Oxa1 family membrane protein insertase